MALNLKKYNPGFLSDDELLESFCVRTNEFTSIIETLQENTGNSNQHLLVIGPRGSGKTTLLLRIAVEIRRNNTMSSRFFPIVFAEESYEVSTCGEFWLECLDRLAVQVSSEMEKTNIRRTWEELRSMQDDQALAERCLGALLDFSDREDKRLVLIVENMNMIFRDIADADTAWRLRKTLQTEPRIMLLASATSRFEEIDNPEQALYDLFRVLTLRPLSTQECATLWEKVSGKEPAVKQIRPLEILTGSNPRLLTIIAGFGAALSLRELMKDLFDLVDEHTEYFRSHIESLSAAQERRVYLALAKLWKPATTREVADLARLDTSQCSAQLQRLIDRGVVSEKGGTPRRKRYYLTERLYNIYYLLRNGESIKIVETLIQFMTEYYFEDDCNDIEYQSINKIQKFNIINKGLILWQSMQPSANPDDHKNLVRYLEDQDTCKRDVQVILTFLSKTGHVPGAAIRALLAFGIALGYKVVLALIEEAALEDLLLPLVTAFRREIGLETEVSQEVFEVAEDIRKDLAKMQKQSVQ